MKKTVWLGMFTALGVAGSASAYEFRCRFVERVGSRDNVLDNNYLESLGGTHTIRIQFGVFDSATGVAPAGGLLGWSAGTMQVGGAVNNSDERRSPGRLAPWNLPSGPNSNGNPPLPDGDPFTVLTDIDATRGEQSLEWVCNADGTIPPQPPANIRGRNTFVSVFAFTVHAFPSQGSRNYSIAIGGNLVGVSTWLPVGNPVAPSCGDPAIPSDDVPGSVTYAAVPTAAGAVACELYLDVLGPSPGAASVLCLGGLMAARRRR